MDIILAPISLGELIDKITILEIKVKVLKGQSRENAKTELEALLNIYNSLDICVDKALVSNIQKTNQKLWGIEDSIREKENAKDFGEEFIHLARSVYLENDRRSYLKSQLNKEYKSPLIEEKLYSSYHLTE